MNTIQKIILTIAIIIYIAALGLNLDYYSKEPHSAYELAQANGCPGATVLNTGECTIFNYNGGTITVEPQDLPKYGYGIYTSYETDQEYTTSILTITIFFIIIFTPFLLIWGNKKKIQSGERA
jgi:hypothetical protein